MIILGAIAEARPILQQECQTEDLVRKLEPEILQFFSKNYYDRI